MSYDFAEVNMMGAMKLSDLGENGERVGQMFERALAHVGREAEDWTIREDVDGVHVRFAAASGKDAILFFGSEEFRVAKISDEEIMTRIRNYQDRDFQEEE